MPNSLAYLALMLWPVVVVVLFARLRADRAFVWSIIGGYLLLPPVASFGMPLIPDLDKLTIPSLSVLLVATLLGGHRIALLPRSTAGRALVLLFVLSPWGTAFTNLEAIELIEDLPSWMDPATAIRALPPLTAWDGLSMMVAQAFVLLPFALARHFLATPEAMREFLRALVIAGIGYSLLMLIEIRLSPQLNIWLYGFFQHDFGQMIRRGGFRPIVFLEHGLWTALFCAMALLAATGLGRFDGAGRLRWRLAAVWLLLVLAFSNSLGALVLALAFAPLLVVLPSRLLLRLAAVIAALVCLYPALRASGVIPADQIIALFTAIDADRASSLAFRLDHEKRLLDHAMEKPWFGWGGWMRNLVIDPHTGRVSTIADGRWVIAFGMRGTAGYAAEFGLLALPLLLLALRRASPVPVAVVAAVIHAVNLIDLLPNGTLTPITWMLAGGLLAQAEQPAQTATRAASAPLTEAPRRTVL